MLSSWCFLEKRNLSRNLLVDIGIEHMEFVAVIWKSGNGVASDDDYLGISEIEQVCTKRYSSCERFSRKGCLNLSWGQVETQLSPDTKPIVITQTPSRTIRLWVSISISKLCQRNETCMRKADDQSFTTNSYISSFSSIVCYSLNKILAVAEDGSIGITKRWVH